MNVWNERQKVENRKSDDARSESDIDYGRIIHSTSFRRLQSKTQILNLGDSDFYRTRLTHSLEVAQIAAGLVKHLRKAFPHHPVTAELPEHSLIQAIGSAHDLGHPPFGHGGEVALNYCMRVAANPDEAGRNGNGVITDIAKAGFEGNGQTLRILSRLETFSKANGANLTRRTLLGILKYPVAYSKAAHPARLPKLHDGPSTLRIIDTQASKPPKCYMDCETEVVDWVLDPLPQADRDLFQTVTQDDGKHAKSLHKSLDCTIMDVADDISYGVHDLEDAIAMQLISRDAFEKEVTADDCESFMALLNKNHKDKRGNDVYREIVDGLFGNSGDRKMFISMLVGYFITDARFADDERFETPLLRHRVKLGGDRVRLLKAFQDVVRKHVIKSPRVQHMEFKGQGMVVAVFEALQSDPERLLPEDVFPLYEKSGGDLRIICDFVAGMTDGYLVRTYERLFSPGAGSVFDRL
ncbi:dGTPase [Agrobacterium larrymoorei]|uniref:DGTPase n=1 Tax=Agrobacterium larrymoorei TaxID=160699 RepID=A0AAJ2BDB5_9HYPH|nr:dGTPase [Agrobacterium larrymoorei]